MSNFWLFAFPTLFCLGIYAGYRYAEASGRVDAVIDHTLSQLDAEREFDDYRAYDRQDFADLPPWDDHRRVS